jgi:hypothetical protein
MRSTKKYKFRPRNPQKYRGDVNNIVCRSSWEKIFCVWCDRNPQVIKWSSEETVVPYYSPVDGQQHRYFVDFWIRYVDQSGAEREKLIEVKPMSQCMKPTGNKFSKGFDEKMRTWAVNQAKWESATKFAADQGMEFQLVTERELGIK